LREAFHDQAFLLVFERGDDDGFGFDLHGAGSRCRIQGAAKKIRRLARPEPCNLNLVPSFI